MSADVLLAAATVARERESFLALVEDLLVWPRTDPAYHAPDPSQLIRARAELAFARRLLDASARVADGRESPGYFASLGEDAGGHVRSCVVGFLNSLSAAYASFARDRCRGRPPAAGLVPSPPEGAVGHVTVSNTLATWATSRLATTYAAELRSPAFLDAAEAITPDGREALLLAAALGEQSGAALETHWRALQAAQRERSAA